MFYSSLLFYVKNVRDFLLVEFWFIPVPGCSGEPGKQGSADPRATGPAAAGGVPGGRRQVMEGEDSQDIPEEKLHILPVRGKN